LIESWIKHGNTLSSTNYPACLPIVHFKETENVYRVSSLPQHILQEHQAELEAGNLFLKITHATFLDDEELSLSDLRTINVIRDPRFQTRTASSRTTPASRLGSGTTGNHTIAVVRISTSDSTPDMDADTLRSAMFSPDQVNLKTQYEACSFGKLQLNLAPAGVVDVYVDESIHSFTSASNLVTAAQQVLNDEMNLAASDLGEKVLMCLPPGIDGWVASSGVKHWRAQFNNEWCVSLTATMHEIGHMLGLLHSNENGKAYGDSSGYMSFGHKSAIYPKKCFNGFKNWQLGWYRDREMIIKSLSDQENFLINLATFVDYDKTSVNEPVLVNIFDKFFLQYNMAKGMNIDTEERENQVTITTPIEGASESLAGLSKGDKFTVEHFRGTGRTLIIEACENRTNEKDVDIMLISVSLDGHTRCPDRSHSADPDDVSDRPPVDLSQTLPALDELNRGRGDAGAGVGRDGFWELFKNLFVDRHGQLPPDVDALVDERGEHQPAAAPEAEPAAEDRNGGAAASLPLDHHDDGNADNADEEGEEPTSLLERYYHYNDPATRSGDTQANVEQSPGRVTSVFAHWLHHDP